MIIWFVPWKLPIVCGHERIRQTLSEEFLRSGILERGKHLRSCLADMAEALGKEFGIAVPQLDVVACRGTCFESDGVANHERGGFRFGFADSP